MSKPANMKNENLTQRREGAERCPFCGGEPKVISRGYFIKTDVWVDWISLTCPATEGGCGCSQSATTEDEAWARWNRRPELVALRTVCAEVADVLEPMAQQIICPRITFSPGSFQNSAPLRLCVENFMSNQQMKMDLPKSAPAVYRQRQLTDESPFPFGKWKGIKMINVPSTYLDWFIGQPWATKWPAVVTYVQRSQKAIQQDLERSER